MILNELEPRVMAVISLHLTQSVGVHYVKLTEAIILQQKRSREIWHYMTGSRGCALLAKFFFTI